MKNVARVMSLMLLAQSSMSFAQANNGAAKPTTPFQNGGIIPTIVASPGDFNITQSDTTKLKTDLLARIGKVQDSDKAYLDEVIQKAINATNKYNNLLVVGEFKKMSDRSVNNQFVKYSDFLNVINDITSAKMELQTSIELLTAASHALPSDATIADAKDPQKAPAPRNIDFSNVMTAINGKLAASEALANQYKFTIQNDDGLVQFINTNGQNVGNALKPQLDFPTLNAKQIKELQQKAKLAATPSDQYEELAESQANQLKKMIAQFVYAYGDAETYRFGDKNLAEARAQALDKIVNGFWMRSYLRKVYGNRVGTILPALYQKRYANIDKFTVLTEQLKTFKELSGPSQVRDEDLGQAVEDIRQVLLVLDERTAKVMSGDASILARVNSFLTYIKGQRPTSEALLLIMQLVAGDIKEEQMLTIGDGVSSVVSFYDARWKATEADVKANAARICAFDAIDNEANQRSNCYQGTGEGGIKSTFNDMNNELNALGQGIEQANAIRKQIRLAMVAQSMSKTGTSSGSTNRRGN